MNIQRLRDLACVNTCYMHCCNRYCNQRLADFPAAFKSKEIESAWYNVWEKNKYFESRSIGKETIKMILPPPNVTGVLHLGHALTVTVQDTLARWHRMNGNSVVWVPGLDHAGIATQAILERHLQQQGTLRSDLGKEEFVSLLWKWKQEKADVITAQLKTLGATLDWSREYFTLSQHQNEAVTQAFLTLNDRGLLYRNKKLINWCPTIRSTLSDIEVEFLEVTERITMNVPGYKKKIAFGEIYEIAYKLRDSTDELRVATTRPETVFGDVAIAVHPEDENYSKYIGRQVWHPLRETFIPVIADSLVKRDFGTGAVKITPAHDELDYAISKNHDLDIIEIIDDHGNMSSAAKEFQGLPRFTAREKVLNVFVERGILKSVKEHKMLLPRCTRSGDIIEYMLKEQWFVKCTNMARRALRAVEDGLLRINPSIHEQLWFDWLGSIRDWCVSRQLWWGHPIPAYYAIIDGKTEWFVTRSKNDASSMVQEIYGPGVELHQDNDVLDTWFSSALLPFSAMGWPSKTQDFQTYYPLSLMETGSDILFFWVARMVMLGLELTDRLPFKEVLLHGVLCDVSGRKMSKSLGNVILPEHVINGISLDKLNAQAKKNHELGTLTKDELKRTMSMNNKTYPHGIPECSVDALRMTLCGHNIKTRTVSFNIVECEANNRFCNKIWQASRYVLLMTENNGNVVPETLTILDDWILSRMCCMVQTVNKAFQHYEFYKAVRAMKEFFYYEFCDFYLEGTKWGFKSGDADVIRGHSYTLVKCLEVFLRTLFPVAPYIADDLYSKLQKRLPGFLTITSLLEAKYSLPEEFIEFRNEDLEKKMNDVLNLVTIIRSLLANVSKKSNPAVHIVSSDKADTDLYTKSTHLIKGGTRIFNIAVHPVESYERHKNSVEVMCNGENENCTLYLLVQDDQLCEQIKNNVEQKRLTLETKLKKLTEVNNASNPELKRSEYEEMENEKKIMLLQEELRRLPMIR